MENAKNAIKLCGPRLTVFCRKSRKHNSMLYTNTRMCVFACVGCVFVVVYASILWFLIQ